MQLMEFFEFVIALVAVGGTFVTIWVVILYQRKEKKLPAAARAYELSELSAMADTMNRRIDSLESILDTEVPGWRAQHEQKL
jgi:phage shock protein B